MNRLNFDIELSGVWLFHGGDFERTSPMCGAQYHASSKAGGALKHLRGFDEPSEWREVKLPHDWLTDMDFDSDADATSGCKRRGVGWYKRLFSLPEGEIESATLVFDGVLGECTVFVNGVTAKRSFSGYTRFSVNIEDYLLSGEENEICVFVDARRHEGWWYEGAGIYRPVRLLMREHTHILRDDCQLRTVQNTVTARVRFTNEATVKARLTDAEGREAARAELSGEGEVLLDLTVADAKYWSPDEPYLYTLTVELERDGRICDETRFSIGIRDIAFSDKGATLNGTPLKIRGICLHQDHAGLGAAVPEEVVEYRVTRLKSLGANAYRTAHHAPSEELLDVCDRLGMLVMVENRHFNVSEETMAQIDALVKLSRNHPSVFLYCAFNEEPWQNHLRGKRIVAKLRERILKNDDTRPVTAAQNGGVLLKHNASEALDVVGINYNLAAYGECHTLLPDKAMLGTENSPTFATRAVRSTDRQRQVFADTGEEYPREFSQPLSETMETVRRYGFVTGCFVWCGLDHRGEPNPFEYPSISSHWGFLDNCGFDKNIANWLRAYYLDTPFVRIARFADAPREETMEVLAYTNARSAELIADGRSYGVRSAEHCTICWRVPSSCKHISVETVGDVAVARDEYFAPQEAKRLVVVDENPRGDEGELRILKVLVVDTRGIPVLSENGILHINGELLGVGNGDPRAHHNDRARELHLFNGMAQIIAQRKEDLTLRYGTLPAVSFKGGSREPVDDK